MGHKLIETHKGLDHKTVNPNVSRVRPSKKRIYRELYHLKNREIVDINVYLAPTQDIRMK